MEAEITLKNISDAIESQWTIAHQSSDMQTWKRRWETAAYNLDGIRNCVNYFRKYANNSDAEFKELNSSVTLLKDIAMSRYFEVMMGDK